MGGAGAGEIDFEFGHPIIGVFRVDEHLLNDPGATVFGGDDVGVAEVSGFGVEPEELVMLGVGFFGGLEALG